MKLAKILILSVIFMLMTSLCLAVTDENLADTGLDVGESETDYFRGSMDKTEGDRYSFLNNAGDWLKYVTSGGQAFTFSDDPDYVQPLSCSEDLSNSPSHVYLLYPGGYNENGALVRAGAACDVGQYVDYFYWSSEAQDDRFIFEDMWYKVDSDELMQYSHYDLDWMWQGLDSEYVQAYYRCFDCEVPLIYGCTDPTATNYDPEATVDDISCEYESCEEFNDYVLINGETRYYHVCDDIVNIREYECNGDQLDYGFVECGEGYQCSNAECELIPDEAEPEAEPEAQPEVEEEQSGIVIDILEIPEEIGQEAPGFFESAQDSVEDAVESTTGVTVDKDGNFWTYVYIFLALLLVLLGVLFFYKPKKGKRRRKK
jgi:hypothetical protein